MPLKKYGILLVLACVLVLLYNIFYTIPFSKDILFENGEIETPKRIVNEELMRYTESVQVHTTNQSPLTDFINYPCAISNKVPLRVRTNRCVRTVNITLVAEEVAESDCVEYKITERTPICTYDPKIDKYISSGLRSGGTWEGKIVHNFGLALNNNNVSHVLDMGCNIGVYSLKAAKLGKYVVSLDANFGNLRLLSKSVILGKLTNSVTLIWNAMSDVYTNVSVYNDPSHKNVGGKRIHPIDKISGEEEILAETIMLDDLEPLFRNKTVAFKMDIESCELQALRGGNAFMNNIDIRFIQMEIRAHVTELSGPDIVGIMRDHGFIPFRNCLREGDLTSVPLKSWPFDVCFMK